MNVRYLIEQLEKMSPDATVVFEGREEDECFIIGDVSWTDDGNFVYLEAGRQLSLDLS